MNANGSISFWNVAGLNLALTRPLVMGILNITPDSFSDGGMYSALDSALSRAFQILDEGADIVDVGGESSRPGSLSVADNVELRRVIPVVERILVERPTAIVSIDTCKASVAKAALAAGARIVNDITAGLGDPEMKDAVVSQDCGVVLMHMRGTPRSMQDSPEYGDVLSEVKTFLETRVAEFEKEGVSRSRIALDPGIGFGKKLVHNLSLLKGIESLRDIGCPVLIGASRKSMLGEITGRPVNERVAASIAVALAAVGNGASIIRVHDVKETVDALKVWDAVTGNQ